MNNTPPRCTQASDMIVSEQVIALSGSLEALMKFAPIASNTTCEKDVSQDSQIRAVLPYKPLRIGRMVLLCFVVLLQAWVRPVCHTGYGGQNRDRNGPERSASGDCNPGADAYSALDPLEQGYGPLQPYGSKRKRDRDPRLPSKSSSKKQTARTFACHFYLHDRLGHSDCLNIRLARISDVRQHLLERTHNQVVHCPICAITFTGRVAEARRRRDTHIQAATCQPTPFPINYPGITEDEEQRIRAIARIGRTNQYTEIQRWYMIWDILFPGEQRPASPFLTDVPDIQRVVDWSNEIFGNDLWRELPNEPWTTTMGHEEQRSGMFNFIESFIAQARGLVGQNVGSVEDDHGADRFSYISVGTPGPSSATADLGVVSLASFGSSRRPVPPASSQPHNLGTLRPLEPSPGELPANVASIPFRLPNNPTMNVTQDTQQHVTPGLGTGMQDPTISSLEFGEFSADDPTFSVNWDALFGNPDARQDNRHGSPGGGGF